MIRPEISHLFSISTKCIMSCCLDINAMETKTLDQLEPAHLGRSHLRHPYFLNQQIFFYSKSFHWRNKRPKIVKMVPSVHLKFGIDRILQSTFSNGKLISPPFVRALKNNVSKFSTGGAHYKVFLVIGNHFKTSPSKRKRIKFTDYQQKQLVKFF